MPRVLAVAVTLGAFGLCIPAQNGGGAARGQGAGEPKSAGAGSTTLDVYTESTSRELFSACDADSDDRLDLFEASDALETLGDPKDSSSFLTLDQNRDGYLQWPEFDAQYRRAIERDGTFRVKTCRRLSQQAPELKSAKPATPLETFLQLHDTNGDGGLDPDEIAKFAREMGLQPAFESQLRMLDLDHSGRVEALELAPIFAQLRSVAALPGMADVAVPSALPAPWGDIDTSGDAAIDAGELAAALRKLDPALARWAAAILAKLDRNQSGKVESDEIPGAGSGLKSTSKAAAELPVTGALLGLR
ncbi:MAG: hypothetical protein KDE27_06320 [Planctomycetes bacterium]|nr:hypothetical protein [Planctomycetota bacterium]